jgi:signal transduction histidine kinase
MVPAAAVVGLEEAGAPIFLAIFTVSRVFSLTNNVPTRIATILAASSLPLLLGVAATGTPFGDAGVPYFLAGIGVGALTGALLHRQRRLTAELRWTLHRLDQAAAAEERRRIAREVHDVVAHSLTVVLLNLGGARRALASHPDLAMEALERAEQVGRESLDGIRQVVGLLRADDEAATDPPEPTVTDVTAIVAQQREVGADVELAVTGDLGAVESLAGATMARITREALTNAQRHAPGAPVLVEVVVAAGRVTVKVTNGPALHAPLDRAGGRQGHGLVGMRERVEALGGSFSAGPSDGGWRVVGQIPLRPGRPTTVMAERRP